MNLSTIFDNAANFCHPIKLALAQLQEILENTGFTTTDFIQNAQTRFIFYINFYPTKESFSLFWFCFFCFYKMLYKKGTQMMTPIFGICVGTLSCCWSKLFNVIRPKSNLKKPCKHFTILGLWTCADSSTTTKSKNTHTKKHTSTIGMRR